MNNIRKLSSIIPLILLIHVIEELLGNFPRWATEHFGTTTYGWYILSHIFLFPIVILISYQAYKKKAGISLFNIVGLQTILLTNGLFHINTSLLFKEYSPGLVSSILIYTPFSYYFYRLILRENILERRLMILSILLGVFISLIVILTLMVDVRI